MKRLMGSANEECELEGVECDCGLRFWFDVGSLRRSGYFAAVCPACKQNTAGVVLEETPEEEEIQIPGELRGTTEKTLEEDIRILSYQLTTGILQVEHYKELDADDDCVVLAKKIRKAFHNINLLGQMKGMRVGMNKENCEFRPLREEHVDLMTLQKWKAVVKEGGFMDSDGSGYLATEDAVSNLYILPSCVFEVTLPDWATHVAWYNK